MVSISPSIDVISWAADEVVDESESQSESEDVEDEEVEESGSNDGGSILWCFRLKYVEFILL